MHCIGSIVCLCESFFKPPEDQITTTIKQICFVSFNPRLYWSNPRMHAPFIILVILIDMDGYLRVSLYMFKLSIFFKDTVKQNI